MRCHNFTDCPPSVAERGVFVFMSGSSCSLFHSPVPRLQSGHRNCYISESLLTSGLWLQQLMESFPPARLAHSFDSANQLAVPADHSIKSSFHFVFSLSRLSFFDASFWCFSCSARRTALAVIFSKCFLRFIIKIWLAAIAALFEFMCQQMLPDYGCGCGPRCRCLCPCLPASLTACLAIAAAS